MADDNPTTKRRIWLTPIPTYGIRAVAIKRRLGWSITYRERGACRHMWVLMLPEHCERDSHV